MARFLARRLVLTIPVLLGVATLVFSLIHLIPGDPAQAMLGEAAPQADVEELRHRLGLDRPLLEQYALFLRGLVRADLGTSLRTGQPVTSQIVERMPATFELAAAAMFVAILVSMGLDTEFWNISWIVGIPWLLLISAAYFISKRRRSSEPAAQQSAAL